MNARTVGLAWVVACALSAVPVVVSAAPHNAPRGGYSLDNRYQHHRYYPARGATFHAVPWGGRRVYYRGSPYFFHEGAWYRPWGRRYVVVAPPIGIGISVLPPYCTTLWFGGVPYYYADDTYYLWHPESREYVVTAPPPAAAQSAPNADVYVYPNRGQNADLQASDRYECHAWAVKQSGFDPTQPLGGVAPAEATYKRADYRRAEAACLEGRGYTVR